MISPTNFEVETVINHLMALTFCGDEDRSHPSYPKSELPTPMAYRGLETD